MIIEESEEEVTDDNDEVLPIQYVNDSKTGTQN